MGLINNTETVHYWLDGYWATTEMYTNKRKGKRYSMEIPKELTTKEINELVKIVVNVINK